MRAWMTLAAAALCVGRPLAAQCATPEPPEAPWIATPSLSIGDSLLSLSADAYGAAYAEDQSGGLSRQGLTGAAIVSPDFAHPSQNGWSLGLRTSFLIYHDRLSGDNYGNDVIEKAYVYLETAYGRIEAGQQDGAAYSLEVTGPLVAGPPAIDDANVTFYIDPSTGQAFANIFPVRTGVFATGNDAKISYYSPRSVDLQIGVSFTPSATKGFPFISRSRYRQNDQKDVTEIGANYVHGFGRTTVHAYAGLAFGWLANGTPGHTDALDWAIGTEIDYKLDWATLAFGGAYRQSTGYTFDVGQSFSHGNTHAVHLTGRLTKGPWAFGLEYSNATASAEQPLPQLLESGYEPSVGYAVNPNLHLVLGYQHLDYSRSSGAFYNGRPAVSLNAEFLYAEFKL